MKNWWFKFDFRVWRTDSALRRCSLETRGFWLECLCAMYEAGEFSLSGSYEDLGWIVGCSPEVVARCVVELQRNKTADVTLGNGNVTLMSRRLKRELNDREQTRLRVRRHRGNGAVTVQSKSKSNKKEEREEKEEEKREELTLSLEENSTYPESPFDNPAVLLYEEKFHVHTGSTFRKEIAARVLDLGVWERLLSDNAARGDLAPMERKKIANWILSAYDERMVKKANERKTEQRLPTLAESEQERIEHSKLPRYTPEEFMRGMQPAGQPYKNLVSGD